MVSPQRTWDKIRRMESKIMAYTVMEKSGKVPLTNEIITFHQWRHGQDVMPMEIARAHQAKFDLKQDIIKNLDGIELTWKDYVGKLKERKDDELLSILEGIKDPSKTQSKKKEVHLCRCSYRGSSHISRSRSSHRL